MFSPKQLLAQGQHWAKHMGKISAFKCYQILLCMCNTPHVQVCRKWHSLSAQSSVPHIVVASILFIKERHSPTASLEVLRTPRFSHTVFCPSQSTVMAVSVLLKSSLMVGFLRCSMENVDHHLGTCVFFLPPPTQRNSSAAFEETNNC